METVADLAERYSLGEVRTTHEQNLVLAHVPAAKLFELWRALGAARLATPNIGLLTDMIVCPGLDFCSLANAGTYAVYDQVQARFDELGGYALEGRAREVLSGLSFTDEMMDGDIPEGGIDAYSVQAYYTMLLAKEAGMTLGSDLGEDDVTLTAQ